MRDASDFGVQSDAIQTAFSVNAVVFLLIFVMINGLMDESFRRQHEHLIVVFAISRLLLGFGVILPEKIEAIQRKRRKR